MTAKDLEQHDNIISRITHYVSQILDMRSQHVILVVDGISNVYIVKLYVVESIAKEFVALWKFQ